MCITEVPKEKAREKEHKKYFKKQCPKLEISSKTLSHHFKKLSELQVEFYKEINIQTQILKLMKDKVEKKNLNINRRQSGPWEMLKEEVP